MTRNSNPSVSSPLVRDGVLTPCIDGRLEAHEAPGRGKRFVYDPQTRIVEVREHGRTYRWQLPASN